MTDSAAVQNVPRGRSGTARVSAMRVMCAAISASAGATICEPWSAAAEVDLVAVVVRRVVRGGDHDARRRVEVPDGEREHRGRQQAGEQYGAHARAGHDLGRVAREHVGVPAPVVADDDRRRRARLRALDEVRGEPCCSLGHEHPVHAVGPGRDRASKAGGAEGESRVEPVGEVGGCLGVAAAHRRDDRRELVTGLGVGVLGDPRLGEGDALRVAGSMCCDIRWSLPVAYRAATMFASSRLMTGSAVLPASMTSCVAQRRLLDARGEVRDERHAEDLHAGLTRGDGLERGRHADDVAADGLGHLHLGGRLVVRPAELAVDALVELGCDRVREVAQPLRVQVGEVDEGGALERGVDREVDVVADEHGGARRPVLLDAAGAVREDHRRRARRRGGADGVDDASHAVALVVVGAGADDERALAARQQHRAQRADVPFERGLREAGHLGRRERVRGLADEFGGAAPAAAEGEGDVVAIDSGEVRDPRCRVGGDGEGVCSGVVERVRIVHPTTLGRGGCRGTVVLGCGRLRRN